MKKMTLRVLGLVACLVLLSVSFVMAQDVCEGDFDCDQDVDAADVAKFSADFGRSSFFYPCNNESQCNGDFDCDGDVDGMDWVVFKSDFGRSSFNNPCPICEVGDWCGY